ncbi:DUF4198 domain-containing protein [Sphingomonas nostoxanthinifaciens]|uniref:DUF4198 domain-containing protein n=1 Tax=Sphingomonas nostoxanthinifaciens TaxID=2872652 RepID=UPI001CC1FEAE|nr:DUF4198 domain-containing protein [Sphingomonas nostoxanthinifaciens]UAK26068.1 DUF4198 domain-containing protein [Sphingomonas nostoxanthinifaciens]
MRNLTTRLLAAAVALAALPAAARAEHPWLLPSATSFSGPESWVTFDGAVTSELFFFDHAPLRLESVKVTQPDGTPGTMQNASTGRYRSVFDVKLDKPGTWRVSSEMAMVGGTFMQNGVERRVGGRGGPPGGGPGGPAAAGGPPRLPSVAVNEIPADATDVKLAETLSRNEVYVTEGTPTTAVFAPTGKGIELVPITHPDDLVLGEPARFRFLVDGQPMAGLKVAVIRGGKRYRNDLGAMDLTTGADGVLTIKWPEAGMYWLNATLTDAKTSVPRATERRLSYSTTLEVLMP